MKKSELSFTEGFLSTRAERAIAMGAKSKALDWDSAANIIKERYAQHPDLVVEAGLQGDWSYTGGVIFAEGHAIISEYTYLSSVWAKPTLILSWSGEEQEEIECYCEENDRFHSGSKWDSESLKILGLGVKELSE